jgi:hypothetical protein
MKKHLYQVDIVNSDWSLRLLCRLRPMFIPFIAVCGSFLVSSCALPPVIAVASYATTGISYMASGKSPSDHALSALTDKDCAIHRVVMSKAVCREQGDPVDDDAVIASTGGLNRKGVRLEGVTPTTEIFALLQDDGALEIFAYDPALPQSSENVQLILKIDGYKGDRESVEGVRLNGKFYAISDILV